MTTATSKQGMYVGFDSGVMTLYVSVHTVLYSSILDLTLLHVCVFTVFIYFRASSQKCMTIHSIIIIAASLAWHCSLLESGRVESVSRVESVTLSLDSQSDSLDSLDSTQL
jgi:hypothetical protein